MCLLGGIKPAYRGINTKHKTGAPCLWLDPETNEAHELKYATNHQSPFVSEQSGSSKIANLGFEDGIIQVGKRDLSLQRMMAYHPENKDNGGSVFEELRPWVEQEAEITNYEDKAEAYAAISKLTDSELEAVMWNFDGDGVFDRTINSLKRDLFVYADKQSAQVIEYIKSDSSALKHLVAKAIKKELLTLSSDGLAVFWGKGKTKVCAVRIGESHISEIAGFLNKEAGQAYLKKIEEKLD